VRDKSVKSALAALAVTVLGLSGCGGDDKGAAQPAATPAASAPASTASSAPAGNGVTALAADEILQRAKAALKQTKSFHAKGTLDQDGQKTDLDLKVDGADFAGSMAFGPAKVELLQVGADKYFRPNEQFLAMAGDAKQGKALAKAVGGRWIAGAEDDKSFAELFQLGSVDELLKPTGALSKGEEKQIGGVPAIGLQDAGDPDSVLYVATTGEPYPVQLAGKGGAAVAFDAFGDTFPEIAKPPAAQVVDFSKLGGK
jgi:hypothetical protein